MNVWKCSVCGATERQEVMPPACNRMNGCGMTWHLIEAARRQHNDPRPTPTPSGGNQGGGSCLILAVATLIALSTLAVSWLSAEEPEAQAETEETEPSLMARRLAARQLAKEKGESGPETAAMKARQWLEENGGIAIIVGDGTEDSDPDELGEKVVERFLKDHRIPAAYFVSQSTARANTLEFENRYFPLGRGVLDKNGKHSGIYVPSMWETKEKADALINEIYEFHIASLEMQVEREKSAEN